jgi:hypothetical protein
VDHEHLWKPVPGLIYALRRCSVCHVLARTSNGVVKIQPCKVCKQPAHHYRLGSPYCDAHLSKPGNLRTLKEMSEEEIRALEKQYGVPVKRKPS